MLRNKINALGCLALLGIITLSGCNYFTGGSDNSEPPMKLTSITAENSFKQLWKVNVGKGDDGKYLKLKPLLVDEKIFTVDSNGWLQARNSNDSSLIWQKKLNHKITQGVAGDKNKLFITTSIGEVLSLNALDGAELWRKNLSKNILNNPGLHSDALYVQATDGTLYSLNATTGKLNWEYKVLIPDLTLYSTSSPLVWKDTVLAGFSSGKIVAFDNKSGLPKWDHQITDAIGHSSLQRMIDVSADPIVVDNTLYAVSYQGKIIALDLANGRKIWERELSAISNITTHQSSLFVSDTDGTVWALNRSNGDILWKQDKLHMRQLSGTSYMDNTIIVGDYEGYLHGLSEKHGEFTARTKLSSGSIRVAPLIKHDIIYILDNKGNLAAYQLNKSTT